MNRNLAYREDRYFRAKLPVDNSAKPVWLGVTNVAVLAVGGRGYVASMETGHVFVVRTPKAFTYDAYRILLDDGRRNWTWDGENRLVKVESRSHTPQASWRRVEWTYDALGRRIRQTTSTWLAQSNLWVVTEDLKFLSDPLLYGWHVVDLNASNNVPVRTYVWGLDLSGTMDCAGGVSRERAAVGRTSCGGHGQVVPNGSARRALLSRDKGGLLMMTRFQLPALGSKYFVAYDGNGNVAGLVNAANGTEAARYEYGPFGEPLRVTGPAASLNPFRFSTKRTCNTTELVLYESRAYRATAGQWLNRDPVAENGGLNLYGLVYNNPAQRSNVDGREMGGRCGKCGAYKVGPWCIRCDETPQIPGRYIYKHGFGKFVFCTGRMWWG